MKVYLDKQYRTREGKKVRIWTVDAKCESNFVVRGEVKDDDDEWHSETWTAHGKYNLVRHSPYDLVEYETPKLRPYRNEELPELRGRWIRRHDWSEHESMMVVGINGDLAETIKLSFTPEQLFDLVFASDDPEAGQPVAKWE